MARRLLADGATSFHRVLTDPRTGAPMEIGRDSYRIPAAMRRWLRLRDGKCPFPGCNNQSLDTEADHVLAWHDGGTTGISNLGQPCRKHHRLRHTTGWRPIGASRDAPPGWVSPSGRRYAGEEYDWEPPWMTDPVPGPPGMSHPTAGPPGMSHPTAETEDAHDAGVGPGVGLGVGAGVGLGIGYGYGTDLPVGLLPPEAAPLPVDPLPVDPLPDWETWIAA
jgi:hypothetical protein